MNKPTKAKVSIQALAKATGFSTASVSRALNNKPNVRTDVREKILAAAMRMNYMPSSSSVVANRIPLFVEDLNNRELGNYENLLISRIAKELTGKSAFMELISLHEGFLFESVYAKAGIAIVYLPDTVAMLSAGAKFPIITINNPMPGTLNVFSDHFAGMYDATTHLIAKGHRRIAVFASEVKTWGTCERLNGYRAALEKQGIPFDPALVGTDSPNIFVSLATVMKSAPTAIIAAGEDYGMEINHGLYLLGKKVPEEISLLVYDDFFARYATPPLSCLAPPFEEIARIAVERAVAVTRGAEFVPGDIVLKSALIERSSVRQLA